FPYTTLFRSRFVILANAGVMASGETFRANLPRHAQKRLKLHVRIAIRAGNGSAAGEVLIHERPDDARLELFLEIHDVMRKIQVTRDGLGVIDVVERAAAMLRWPVALQLGQAALVPELHREADDGAALLLKERSDGGGIDATGHGHGDEAGLRLRALGKRVELCGAIHGVNLIVT